MEQTPLKTQLESSFHHQDLPSEDPQRYITVTCRLKPLLPQEEKSKIEVDKNLHHITLNDPTKSISKTYTFDRVFDETICQDRFANSICNPLVNFLKNGGESGLIFSYGITNSGKTYTILGTNEQPGILLTLIKKLEHEFPQEKLKIVACELYKDEFMSLKNKGQKLHPKQVKGTISFEDCDSDEINESNMRSLFENFLQNRSCAPTNHNSQSSRSHAIFKITGKNFKIGIVDLAGSERTSKIVGENNADIKETIFINSSLLTLKKCIKTLEERSNATQKLVVPYRESKLTQAIMEYFVINSKINIIVNINQGRHCLEQNLNAMDYTSKAKNITANATNDFSKMMKILTQKKKTEGFSVIKPKLFQSNTQEVKRYSVQMMSQEKYIIDEEMVEAEEIELSLEREIKEQDRRSELMRRQSQQMFDQIVERPNIIEDFIEKQRLFREVYLATDLAIQMETDQRKLSALRKVNLMETTEKKQKTQSQRKLVNPVETVEFGTEIHARELISESDLINEKLANMEWQNLKTAVKKKLMNILDEEKRKQLIDAETMWSERKSQNLEKGESKKIEERSVEQEEESNYTTPTKKNSKHGKSMKKTKTIIKASQGKGIFKSIAKGAHSTFNGIKSCVKSGAKFITGFGKSAVKSNPSSIIPRPKSRKVNLQYHRQMQMLIKPEGKIFYEIGVQTDIEIVASSRKVRYSEQYPQMNADGDIEIDLPPIVVEKEVIVDTFDVGIQTEDVEMIYVLQKHIDQNIQEKQENKNQEMEKKEKKHKKAQSTFSEESTVIEENEEDTIESPEQKPKHNKKGKNQVPVPNEKTAFKNFAINKANAHASVKKHKAYISAAKTGIAKNTRGAQKKKANNGEAKWN